MKDRAIIILTILAAAALFAITSSGQGLVPQSIPSYFYEANNSLNVLTNTITATFTNQSSATNTQNTYPCLYNTFEIVFSASGTNAGGSNVFESTIDGTDWIPQQTNTVGATNSSSSYTFTGVWLQIRSRTYITSTNGTFTQYYAGRSP